MQKEVIAVWFSSGAASAVAAKKTIENYGETHTIRVINNPIAEEDSDNKRFLKDVEKWIEYPIEYAVNKKYPNCSAKEVWAARKFMSGPKGAPCTLELKKGARHQWEQENHADWHVLGFTADEFRRHAMFVLTERANVIPVLIDAKITKRDCYNILMDAGLELPRVYKEGYPNANCIGCVKATSATYWNHVRSTRPEIFDERAAQSREIGAKLVRHKGVRMFLDEHPSDAKGRSMKGLDFECGIFCEEKPRQ